MYFDSFEEMLEVLRIEWRILRVWFPLSTETWYGYQHFLLGRILIHEYG